MGIRDNFRRRLEALNADIIKRDADRQGEAKSGLSTGAGHNPITGTPSVRQPDGGIVGTTTPITSGSLGQGNPVQVTGNGLRTVVDAAQAKAGEDLASASSIAGRGGNPGGGGGGGNSFIPSPIIPGYNPDLHDGGWVPGEDGSCEFKIFPKGKRPPTAYADGQECLDDNQPGIWVCVDGVCTKVEVPPTDKPSFEYKRECESALGGIPIRGGQCVGVQYRVSYASVGALDVTTCLPRTLTGSVIGTGPIGPIEDTLTAGDTFGWTEGAEGGNATCRANGARSTGGGTWILKHQGGSATLLELNGNSIAWAGKPGWRITSIERTDGESDNCGDAPRQCPS